MKFREIQFIAFLLFSCNPAGIEVQPLPITETNRNCEDLGEGWSVPRPQVVSGASKDAIPAIEDPRYVSTLDVDYLLDNELVIGTIVNGELRAYPHRILEKHEIVNGRVGDTYYSLTFCPLTGTSITWKREPDNSFGVSGLLHNSNLITYDRKTDSKWSQIYSRGINGDGLCESLEIYPTLEMSWNTWRTLFPDSKVLSFETGINFYYGQPAQSYSQPENVTPLFPIYHTDTRLPNYERVLLIVIDNQAKAYRMSGFKNGTRMVEDLHAGRIITIVGNVDMNFIVPLISTLDGARYFTLNDNRLVDIDGNVFTLFGEAIEGPDKGVRLEIPYSMMGYWFAISAFFPDIEIFNDEQLNF